MKNSSGKYYPVVVLSDLHLGSVHSKVRQIKEFLDSIRCDTLILNGDIVDFWQVRGGNFRHWIDSHTDVLRAVIRKAAIEKTRVVYVVGNHDALLLHFTPLKLHGIEVKREFSFSVGSKRYLVVHGDVFDKIEQEARWLSLLGDKAYDLLLWLNHQYNRIRARFGRSYRSISLPVKQGVKRVVSFISKFEESLSQIARERGFDGVICGHIHQSANTYYDGLHYLNSGDWVENLTALTLDEESEWHVYNHLRDYAQLKEEATQAASTTPDDKSSTEKRSPYKIAM